MCHFTVRENSLTAGTKRWGLPHQRVVAVPQGLSTQISSEDPSQILRPEANLLETTLDLVVVSKG